MRTYRDKGLMFFIGIGVACLLAFSIGAAPVAKQPDRYDANFMLGGLGLKILDRRTNTIYLYSGKKDEKGTYTLEGSIDLNLAGQPEIMIDNLNDDNDKGE